MKNIVGQFTIPSNTPMYQDLIGIFLFAGYGVDIRQGVHDDKFYVEVYQQINTEHLSTSKEERIWE